MSDEESEARSGFASPQVLAASTTGAGVVTNAMYAATGPVGLAVTAGVGAGSAAGVWGVRKFAPALAARWGLAKQAGKAAEGARGVLSRARGLGSGLLGRRTGRGGSLLGSRSGGLLGNRKGRRTGAGGPTARRVAGKPASRGTGRGAGRGTGRGAGRLAGRAAVAGQRKRPSGLLAARNARNAAKNSRFGTRTARPGTGTGRKITGNRKNNPRRAATGRKPAGPRGRGARNGARNTGSKRRNPLTRNRRAATGAKRNRLGKAKAKLRGLRRGRGLGGLLAGLGAAGAAVTRSARKRRGQKQTAGWEPLTRPTQQNTAPAANGTPAGKGTPATRSGARSAARSTTRRTTAMANPYQAQIEALQAGGSQEIENARKLLDMTKHMPDTGLALADMLKRNAESMAEQIPVDDSVIQMIDQFARHQQTFAQDMDEIDAQVRKAHEVQIRNIEEPRPNAEKWDVAANRD